jgi:hypothetical protein
MSKYYFLLVVLIILGLIVTGVLVYRAHQTDLYYVSKSENITQQ